MVAAIYGRRLRKKEAKKMALESLELVELAGKRHVVTAHMTLSDGRLLEVARVLASTPSVTLFDEHMAGINPPETIKMLQVVNKVRGERSVAILWVEH